MDKNLFSFPLDKVEIDWDFLNDLQNGNTQSTRTISGLADKMSYFCKPGFNIPFTSILKDLFPPKWTALSGLKIASHTWSDPAYSKALVMWYYNIIVTYQNDPQGVGERLFFHCTHLKSLSSLKVRKRVPNKGQHRALNFCFCEIEIIGISLHFAK